MDLLKHIKYRNVVPKIMEELKESIEVLELMKKPPNFIKGMIKGYEITLFKIELIIGDT